MSTLQSDPRERVQLLDESSEVVESARVPDLSEETFVEMYEGMRLVRRFNDGP